MRIAMGFVVLLSLLAGCSKTDQERAKTQADEAARKTRADMHKLGTEAKADAQKINSELSKGLKGTSTAEADAKLRHAGDVARTDAAEAGRALDHAAVVARVKAKLAADVGLSTVANVTVDSQGSTVILSGSVSNADQKRLAEQAAAKVDGVTRVENRITVQP